MTNGEGTKGGGEDQWNDFLCHCIWPPRLTWKSWGQEGKDQSPASINQGWMASSGLQK